MFCPKTYNRLDKELLVSLLKNFAAVPMDIEGDAFGKIYEYFLGKFAMSEGQKGGEFFTPTSIVKLIVEIIEPLPRTHSTIRRVDQAACSSSRRRSWTAPQEGRHGHFDLRSGEGCRDHPALQDEPAVHGLSGDIRQGVTYYEDIHKSVGKFDFRDGKSAIQRGQGGQGAAEGRSTLPVRIAENRQRQLPLDSDFLFTLNQRASRDS
jgi:type I restriction enzyme M protein